MKPRSLLVISLCVVLSCALLPSASGRSLCRPFKVGDLDTTVSEEPEAREAPVLRLTDRHTEERPLEIHYNQGKNLWVLNPSTFDWLPIIQDTVYVNAQVLSKRRQVGLHARIEWGLPSPSEIDLGLYNHRGRNVYWSGAFNNFVLDTVGHQVFGPYSGGDGYEEIRGWPAHRCDGFTFESWSMETPGERVTMKLWLAEIGDGL